MEREESGCCSRKARARKTFFNHGQNPLNLFMGRFSSHEKEKEKEGRSMETPTLEKEHGKEEGSRPPEREREYELERGGIEM